MSDNFALQGFWRAEPATVGTVASGCPSLNAPIYETLLLAQKQYTDITLGADSAEAVAFGDVTSAHVVIMKASGKVTARLTSSEGTTQIVPFDSFLILLSETVPYTAVDLQRVAGQSTTVKVFLGEKT